MTGSQSATRAAMRLALLLHATAAADDQRVPAMADRRRRVDDEPEEGEVGAGYHSETDTEEYYNRHSPSGSDDDGATSSVARGRGATTCKRGSSGSAARAVSHSPPSAEPEQPVAVGAADAEPKVVVLQPTPRADLSGQSGSAQPAHGDAAMEIEIAAAGATSSANPPTEAIVHHHHHQQLPVAPPPAAAGEQPALVHQPQRPVSPPPAAGAGGGRQDPNGYTCKECGMWFAMHQALGGHTVGHRNRELAAGAPAADVPVARRNPRPEKAHVCDQCGAVFRAGVQLGGHKRKHWTGPPIVPKKRPRVAVRLLPPPEEAVADLTLALAVIKADEAPPATPAVEAARPAAEGTPEPAPRPPAATRVLLFGIDIGAGAVQKPLAQQGSPAAESSGTTSGQQ